jgi:hypothetical protein
MNDGEPGGAYEYDIEALDYKWPSGKPGRKVTRIKWGGFLEGHYQKLIEEAEHPETFAGKAGEARAFLITMLSSGPKLGKDLEKQADVMGIKLKTLHDVGNRTVCRGVIGR